MLSRVLWGGRSVLGLALAATVLAYGFGVLIGLVAGYKRSLTDPILMRSVDILLAVPPLLFLLVLVTAVGTSVTALVIGVALIQMPGIARLVRTVTVQVSVRSYVEAPSLGVKRHQRSCAGNFTGHSPGDHRRRWTPLHVLGAVHRRRQLPDDRLQPPASDWALMISENRRYISINPWAVVAPAMLIAALTIGINLMGDAIGRSLGRSSFGTPGVT